MKKRSIIVCICLLLAASLMAAPRYGRTAVTHWLGLSLTGVEANMLPTSSSGVKPKAGYGGQAHLQYELHAGKFFFNAGLGVDYIVTNNALASSTYTPISKSKSANSVSFFRFNSVMRLANGCISV